jgi:DNA replication protein DnaC
MIQELITILKNLKCYGMAQALETQLDQPDLYRNLTFFERLELLVQQEQTLRENKRLDRLLKQAKLKMPAHIKDIKTSQSRGITREGMVQLQSLRWVTNHRNILITGPTGSGKTYLACALADHCCVNMITARYYRLPRLLEEFTLTHATGSFQKFLSQLQKIQVLIIDDWALDTLKSSDRHDLLEIFEDRYNSKTTILTSQYPVEQWHNRIGDPTMADAILDRIIHNGIRVPLAGDSLRKTMNALDESEHLT